MRWPSAFLHQNELDAASQATENEALQALSQKGQQQSKTTHSDWVTSTSVQASLANKPDCPAVQTLRNCAKPHLLRNLRDFLLVANSTILS